jgi:hypothetical protein
VFYFLLYLKNSMKTWLGKFSLPGSVQSLEVQPQWTSRGPGSMLIERYHHIDASEQDKDGFYDYYYEYDVYSFVDGPVSLMVRCYTDDSERADFQGIKVDGDYRGLELSDLKHPMVLAAQTLLRAEGKVLFCWLTDKGYEPMPTDA